MGSSQNQYFVPSQYVEHGAFSFTGFSIGFRTMACQHAAEPILNIVYASSPSYVEYFQSQYAEHGRFVLVYSGLGMMAHMNVAYP